MKKIIKRIRVTRDFFVVGNVRTENSQYWQKDFREMHRVPIGKEIETEIESFRTMSEMEESLLDFHEEC